MLFFVIFCHIFLLVVRALDLKNGNIHLYARTNYARIGEWKLRFFLL